MRRSGVCRRGFLGRVALGGTGWLILRQSASARSYQANEKLNIALVGVGTRGTGMVREISRVGENLVAMCDVDKRRAEPYSDRQPRVPFYQDFRVMLEEMGDRIDAVMAALPCHAHASVAAAAMHRGKHVYIEKPAAHSVAEARALRRIARQRQVVSQMGNQGMATDSFRRTLERVWEGDVGEVREAHIWFVFGGSGPRQPPTDSQPVPDYLDWDVWLGPAPLPALSPRLDVRCVARVRYRGTRRMRLARGQHTLQSLAAGPVVGRGQRGDRYDPDRGRTCGMDP
jgi:hypothetical protein